MANKRLLNYFVTVLTLILLLQSCGRSESFHERISQRGELVVATDIDMPGLFALEGEDFGYQRDVMQAYADALGVSLRIVTGITQSECHAMMETGQADMILALSADMKPYGNPLPLYKTSYAVVSAKNVPEDGFVPSRDFRNSRVIITAGFASTPEYERLIGIAPGADIYISSRSAVDEMEELSVNGYDYLICEKSEANLGCDIFPDIEKVYLFPGQVTIGVVTTEVNRGMREDFSAWLEMYGSGEEGAMLNDIYFVDGSMSALADNREGFSWAGISPYDKVIRDVSREEGVDWRLMTAIAYHESRFDATVVSKRGARGIMQIMPVTARHFGVPTDIIGDTEVNVKLAAKLLNEIESMMKLPAGTPYLDRTSLVLAAYNCGVGHVSDARRLAKKYGGNPNSWADVSNYLRLKAQPEYYTDDSVRSGVFRGSRQTLSFVNNVINKYNSYCRLAAK